MFKPRLLLSILILLLFCTCTSNYKYSYAIKDFREPLQPHLFKIVSEGIVTHHNRALVEMATDKELIELGQSEHPVLRASAFREMLNRKSFNHFDVLMSHLDDTAIVDIDDGEFGTKYSSISDDLLLNARWKSQEDKNRTIDEVITSHNYLNMAYAILSQVKNQEKYYPFIKDMATRIKKNDMEYGELEFDKVEQALYALARFKKKEDIPLIQGKLLLNHSSMSALSFNLMRDFPDTAYLEVYEKYYAYPFYQWICRHPDSNNALDFISSIAVYKNQRSANILDSILNRKPFVNCPVNTGGIKEALAYAIWKNECIAYARLRRQVEPAIKHYEKDKINLAPIKSVESPANTSEEKISWLW